MPNQTLLVNREDFADVTLVTQDEGALNEGYVRVEIGPFALTANNITYMVTGNQIGYWKFFEPSDYGIKQEGVGRMPVWGYGLVAESKCEGIAVGAKIYGFFPIAKFIDLKPVKLNPMGFQDGIDHRALLHPVYNSYTFTDADPSFAAAFNDLQPVLRPLFTTSFLIDDFFEDSDYFGAQQIIIISASSKTALGTAFCLKESGGVKVIGLTSEGNKQFVEDTGFYHEVQTYDTITDLNPDVKTAIIDMAGNGKVNGDLYDHFEENLVYNCMVGKSHWKGAPPPKAKKGAPPVMFFAPDRAKLRMGEWGGAGFAKNLGARWMPFCQSASSWLTVSTEEGAPALLKCYKDHLNNQVDPAKGYLFKL